MIDGTRDYRKLFLQDVPLMDVRAPIEFARGAFPCAVNLPLLDNKQRALIGTRYKKAGQDEAIRLGLKLATPVIRKQRLADWLSFSAQNPNGFICCYRGGLRSHTTQQWMREQGVDYPLVEGGYQSMRRYLLAELESSAKAVPLICVGGLTGVGKTRLLRKIRRHIDFEGLANHRGSAFGRDTRDRQPTTISWENQVAIRLIKHRADDTGHSVFVEDEGRRIGRINMPDCLFSALLEAPRAILQLDMDDRIGLICEDYILNSWPAYQCAYGGDAETEFGCFVLDNLSRIQKRLGAEAFRKVRRCFEFALSVFYQTGSALDFGPGIRILLEQYYDPMYRYQIAKKQPKILFEGPAAAFLEWANDYCGN